MWAREVCVCPTRVWVMPASNPIINCVKRVGGGVVAVYFYLCVAVLQAWEPEQAPQTPSIVGLTMSWQTKPTFFSSSSFRGRIKFAWQHNGILHPCASSAGIPSIWVNTTTPAFPTSRRVCFSFPIFPER